MAGLEDTRVFLDALRRCNPRFIEAAVELHRSHAIPAPAFMLDLSAAAAHVPRADAEAMGARMLEEMSEQPGVIEQLLTRRHELHTAIAKASPASLRGAVLVARGSSDNAALFGRYLLESLIERPVTLAAPSLWTRYAAEHDLDGYLAIGLSQSGRTDEIAMTLDRMGQQGAATVAITNDVDSPVAQSADLVLELGSGPELAVPATKTFTAQLAMLAVVAEALSERRWSEPDWRAVAAAQRDALNDLEATGQAARLLARSRSTVHISRGYALAVAHESALKLVECANVPSQPYSAPDFLHGPLAVAAPDVTVVAYGAPGPAHADIKLAARKAGEWGAPVIGVGLAGDTDLAVSMANVPEPLAPLVLVIRAQQLAYRTAVELGLDPDTPAGLTKVTRTS
jgi:glucosamine--fructose-6-phosphate aminotransferase (isomerizing)